MTLATPLAGSVEYWAVQTPDRAALRESARSLTWSEWNAQADRLADVLFERAGIGPGEHVAVCMTNRLEWFVAQAAAAKLGAALVPVSHRLTPAEIHYIVADSGARAFVFDAENVDALARVWGRDVLPGPAGTPDRVSSVTAAVSVMRTDRSDVLSFGEIVREPAATTRLSSRPPRSVVYTSGTTGRPRGVIAAARAKPPQPSAAATAPPQVPDKRNERNLLGAPLNHAAGQGSARGTLYGGGCVYLMPRFDAREALRIIDAEKITITFLVPTMLNRIVNLPPEVLAAHDVSSIQLITTGASPCPQAMKEQVIAYFGAHCLVEGYGTTEVGMIARMYPDDHLRKPGACGRLFPNVEVRIVDAEGRRLPNGELGEIFVKTPVMIERYLNEPPPSELIDGFFGTGDVGRFDSDGFLYVLDRKKDMIIAGGVNIYPAEIEDVLRQHPAVLDAAVFGVPHAELGEQVQAVVECIDGRTLAESQLLDFIADKLAGYKRPRAIAFVSEIPRNAAGKPLKTQLRAPYWAGTGKTI